ncbi:hypothetical protein [Streptomyces spiralis]
MWQLGALAGPDEVHAVDGGHLDVWFGPGPEQYGWNSHHVDIRVTALTAGATAQCTHGTQSLSEGLVLIQCDLQPGDTDIVYTLTSAAGTESWKINAHARYKVYSYRTDYRTADAAFAVDGPPSASVTCSWAATAPATSGTTTAPPPRPSSPAV